MVFSDAAWNNNVKFLPGVPIPQAPQGGALLTTTIYKAIIGLMVIFLVITGIIETVINICHNSGTMNENEGTNNSLSLAQVVVGSIIIICAITAGVMTGLFINENNFYNRSIKSSPNYQTFISNGNKDPMSKVSGLVSGFYGFLFFSIFIYGIMLVGASSDRMNCVHMGNCTSFVDPCPKPISFLNGTCKNGVLDPNSVKKYEDIVTRTEVIR